MRRVAGILKYKSSGEGHLTREGMWTGGEVVRSHVGSHLERWIWEMHKNRESDLWTEILE